MAFFPRHNLARIIHCRTVSLLALIKCFFLKYSAARVGPNPSYTGADKIVTACCSIFSSILRFEDLPRSPWITALSPCLFSAYNSRFTCRTLSPSSFAASRCVISFFLTFFSATSRSRSAWVISSCPSCIPQAWGCQGDISTLPKGDIITLLPQNLPGCPVYVRSVEGTGWDHWGSLITCRFGVCDTPIRAAIVRSCERIGWQAKAPAPQKRKPLCTKVGQTLSSVNPAISAILSQLLRERRRWRAKAPAPRLRWSPALGGECAQATATAPNITTRKRIA